MTEFYAGQIAYQDLFEPKTLKMSTGDGDITRGMLCTIKSDGYLKRADPLSGKPAIFPGGVFVAVQSVKAPAENGGATCQVACVRSRVVLQCGAGIPIGAPVQTADNSRTKIAAGATAPVAYSIIGTLYEFPGQPDKIVSENNDFAVIDIGIGVN